MESLSLQDQTLDIYFGSARLADQNPVGNGFAIKFPRQDAMIFPNPLGVDKMKKVTFVKTIGIVEALKLAKKRNYSHFNFHANYYPPQGDDWTVLEKEMEEMLALIDELKVNMVHRRLVDGRRSRKETNAINTSVLLYFPDRLSANFVGSRPVF